MIKTLIILLLAAVVIGGLALSRPDEEDFKNWYRQQADARAAAVTQKQGQAPAGVIDKLRHDYEVSSYLRAITYKNRLLWADVEHEGKTVYTGACGRWFERGEAEKK